MKPAPRSHSTSYCTIALTLAAAAVGVRPVADEPNVLPTVTGLTSPTVASSPLPTIATTNVVTAAAVDPLMSPSILQATTGNLGNDPSDDVVRRRRELRGGITNVPPRSVSSHGGALLYIARERKPGNALQLLNPFAPAGLGTGSPGFFEWHPTEGLSPLPRSFRDERTHEAQGISIIGLPR